MAIETDMANLQGEARGNSLWSQSLRRLLRKKVGMTCLAIITVFYLAGILSPWITPYDYREQDLTATKQGPSLSHPFGTDRVGRDYLTRIVYGLRTTVIITVASVVTGSLFLGLGLGLISGYFGKLVDSVIMRIGDVFLAFPGIFLVIIIAATVGDNVRELVRDFEDYTGIDGLVRLGISEYLVVFGALSAFSWVGMARLVRGQVLSVKENQYVEAARAVGASTRRILLSHVSIQCAQPGDSCGVHGDGLRCRLGDRPELAGHRYPAAHAQPGSNDLPKWQRERPTSRPTPSTLPGGHDNCSYLRLQPAGRRPE